MVPLVRPYPQLKAPIRSNTTQLHRLTLVYSSVKLVHHNVVEKTVWHYASGGTWTGNLDINEQVLTMGGSGTSGALRFKVGEDYFCVPMGIDDYKSWCDLVINLEPKNTAVEIHPTYYDGTNDSIRQKHVQSINKTAAHGHNIGVQFTTQDGNNFWFTITIT
ncbi:Boletus edulis lectin [Grifola frondosa]|uniref:Boletus edulis lectin n=1 Tax=Grifola frondosa TaxID=5627 RepID=A0A1C7MK90_GRIFR|nr:Boletus edulis lectin [Grifola frondosa]